MIRRNVDVLAVVVLLAVIAVYSQAREAMLLQVIPNHGIVLAGDIVHHVLGNCQDAPLHALPSLAFYR